MTPKDLQSILDEGDIGLAKMALRPNDVALFVQPNILTVRQMQLLSARGVIFEAIGHDPRHISGEENLRAFRRLKTKIKRSERHETRGRDPKWPVPTLTQKRVFVANWHSPMKRGACLEAAREALDQDDYPLHVLMEWIKKITGSAARSPEHPAKLPPQEWSW